jgi:hypothetical protein
VIELIRYRLSLSSFAGIVAGASHWWCRVRWLNEAGDYDEADAEHGRGFMRSGRFDTKSAARSSGVRLARKLADGRYYVVTEGSECVIDPQRCLSAPGNLKRRLNELWTRFEKLDGWDAPESRQKDVQAICDSWSSLIGERWKTRASAGAGRCSSRSRP